MFTLNDITKNDSLNYFVTSLACPMCDAKVTIEITPDKLFAYNQGAYAQDVLSEYPDYIREQFISGTCEDCWNAMWAGLEED